MGTLAIRPFTIHVPDAAIADLGARLAATRWPDEYEGGGWELGTDKTYLRDLCAYWASGFDWRARESELNLLPQFTARIADHDIHFVHARSTVPGAMPLVLTHGWPGSFVEMAGIIPMLTDPARFGHDPADAFHVVAPSIPGFGFSSRPTRPGIGPAAIADMWAALMAGLGYDGYGVQGGDFGSTISVWLARHHADHVAGLHLNLLPGALRPTPESLAIRPYGPAELAWLDDMARFADQEGSYAHQHRTKPQTLGFALNDSPAGLAAWIAEKFRAWSDCGGVIERAVSRDALLTNISIYWFTETITSSMRLYRETLSQPPQFDDGDRAPPPFGFAVFPAEIGHPPRELAERFFHIARWTEMPRGGHFAALEQPELLAHELREFFRPLRRAG